MAAFVVVIGGHYHDRRIGEAGFDLTQQGERVFVGGGV
jgi:hypothetical protein